MKKVAIVLGNASDWEQGKLAAKTLKTFGVPFSANVISAYKTPARALDFSSRAMDENVGVIIAVSGPASHLSGTLAAGTVIPVIAVPVSSNGNMDVFFTYVQTPKGVPVATVGIDDCENAALLAIQILALNDHRLADELLQYRSCLTDSLVEADFMLQREIEKV